MRAAYVTIALSTVVALVEVPAALIATWFAPILVASLNESSRYVEPVACWMAAVAIWGAVASLTIGAGFAVAAMIRPNWGRLATAMLLPVGGVSLFLATEFVIEFLNS